MNKEFGCIYAIANEEDIAAREWVLLNIGIRKVRWITSLNDNEKLSFDELADWLEKHGVNIVLRFK